MLNLLSVVSDPIVVISDTGTIRYVNDAMLSLLRIDTFSENRNIRRYLSAETYAALMNVGLPEARNNVYRVPVELIDARHQGHRTEARLVSLGDSNEFAGCYALLLDDRPFVVHRAYGGDSSDLPLRVRVREHGAGLLIRFDGGGVIREIDDPGRLMTGCAEPAQLGRVVWSLSGWSEQAEFERELKRCMQSLASTEKQYMPGRLNHSNGESVWMELCLSKQDNDYLIEGYDVTSRVVSELSRQQYTERLARLSRKLIRAQESERRRIAQELHDQIGQLLTALRLGLHGVRHSAETDDIRSRLDVSMDTVDKVLAHLRSLSLDLRPAMLEDLGLPAALNWFGARQSELTGLRVEVFAQELEQRLPSIVEVECFRIVQEAVANAMRHSQSEEIHISMSHRNDTLELVVEDFGVGFDAQKVLRSASGESSVGLENMQQRVALVGGEFNLDSIEGRGCRVRIRIPTNQ
ncbi:MAG: sensor histidine kinase [Pseudomonadota bacterium]